MSQSNLLPQGRPLNISLIHAVNERPVADVAVPIEDKGVQWQEAEREQQQEEEQRLEKDFQQIIEKQRQETIPHFKHQCDPKPEPPESTANGDQQKQLEV